MEPKQIACPLKRKLTGRLPCHIPPPVRRPRMIAPKFLEKAYYHCVSRVVNRDFVLGEVEKEQFIEFMRTYERLYKKLPVP